MKNFLSVLTVLLISISGFAGTITSSGSGLWSNPNTWVNGVVPTSTDNVVINTNHNVILNSNITIAGIVIDGTLTFDSTQSITLQSTQNIVVNGELRAKPGDYNIVHLIKFVGINEANFVGGGMSPIATDIGLWVMGSGYLNLEGTYKKPFTNTQGSVSAGANSISIKDLPDGWKPNDELTIAPTIRGSRTFDEANVQSISITSNGKIVYLDRNLTNAHPEVNGMWTAEVINLTRNVRIEGTASGRTHIFIRSDRAQRILNTQLRYIGPRKQQSGSSATEFILGRYGFHFHHCMEGSIGTIIDGCVVRDAGSHAYVPHMSDGITMSHNVAYKCTEAPFWWDLVDPTNDCKWVGNIVAAPTYIEGSIGIDTDGAPTFGVHGFVLSMGDGNICDSNVVVGQIGNETVNAAYDWEEMDVESAWQFKDNVAHNCDNGLRSWQNNQKNHVLENTVIYNSDMGVFHGAYGNNYTYKGGYIYGSVFEIHAAGQENSVRLENMIFDGGKLIDYPIHLVDGPIAGVRPIFIRNSVLKNGLLGHLWNESDNQLKNVDMIHCTVSADSIKVNPNANETVRVQPLSGQPYRVKKAGITNISAFAPTIWGTGNGLKGEYFNNTDFTSPAVTRTEPVILFEEWQTAIPGNATGVHYSISDLSYSIRYTGWLEPQYTENYVFKTATGGGVKLWVNDVLIINQWSEPYPTTRTSSSIALTAGQKYKIKLEYFNTDDKSNLSLYWQSTSLAQQIIPQTQLYTDTTGTPPPVNQAPIAHAGSDLNIQLPVSSVNLNGSTSTDSDGTIVSYHWSKVSGPGTYTITNEDAVSTSVTNLVAGTYTFRLTITDNQGATSFDDVIVVVQPANVPPVANAGNNETINLQFTLSGTGTDSDGSIVSYLWEKVTGPACTIVTPNQSTSIVNNLQIGTYVFRLTVTDNQGATATSTVTKIIQ